MRPRHQHTKTAQILGVIGLSRHSGMTLRRKRLLITLERSFVPCQRQASLEAEHKEQHHEARCQRDARGRSSGAVAP